MTELSDHEKNDFLYSCSTLSFRVSGCSCCAIMELLGQIIDLSYFMGLEGSFDG